MSVNGTLTGVNETAVVAHWLAARRGQAGRQVLGTGMRGGWTGHAVER